MGRFLYAGWKVSSTLAKKALQSALFRYRNSVDYPASVKIPTSGAKRENIRKSMKKIGIKKLL